VVLHPLVLLSVVDHYNRVARDSRKRVVGVLLGAVHRGVVDITTASQSLLRRMPRTQASGSWTTVTWRTSSGCSRR